MSEYKQIEKDVDDLNTLMFVLHNMVQEQTAQIDTLEDWIDASHEDVKQGTKELEQASEYSTQSYWMTTVLGIVAVGSFLFLRQM
jgi:t-SNARE complex subunit (syntaxin)